MKTITITLKDDDLRAAIESEAKIIGATEEDMIIQALQFWLAETEPDCEERRELDSSKNYISATRTSGSFPEYILTMVFLPN